MSEEAPKNPLARRIGLKGNVTRISNKLTPEFLNTASLQLLLLLEERLHTSYSEYENVNLDLADEKCDEDPTYTEDLYFSSLEKIRTQLSTIKQRESASNRQEGGSAVSKLKLPDIHIAPFDGKYLEFIPFIDMFRAVIHRDDGITDIQKFFYLRHFLKGEALDLVKNLPVVASSYTEALKILEDRYDNPFKITSEHINGLLDLPSMNSANASSLRHLISETKQHLAALKNLKQPTDKWDTILLCILSRKLDSITSRAYYLERDDRKTPTFDHFMTFLENRAAALENSGDTEVPTAPTLRKAPVNTKVTNVVVKEVKCPFCKSNHKLFSCPKFALSSISERLQFVKLNNLCKICLNAHTKRCKFFFKCQECKQSHNTLLHNKTHGDQIPKEVQNVTLLSKASVDSHGQVLLPTAKVKVLDINGKDIVVKALLDSASQSSFITSKLAKKLGKPLLPNFTHVSGIAKMEKNVNHSMQIDIFSRVYPCRFNVNCLIVDKITTNLPQNSLDLSSISLPKNIKLADDSFHITSEIDILLASDIFFQALLPQPEELRPCDADAAQPKLVHTQFGYIVAGGVPGSTHQGAVTTLFCQDCDSLNDSLSQFWKTESVPEVYKEHTSEQQLCENIFKETVKLENNKFTVSIPLKISMHDVNNTLGNSFSLALKRFLNLEKRLQKDTNLFKRYKEFIDEYVSLGHASYFDISQYNLTEDPTYFLPHHPVLKEDAISTKLRVVFDGSMRTNNKISLNDIMLNGSIQQPELFDTLLLFRIHEHFFICDIRRMFRNILVQDSQRLLQNILWRDNVEDEIKCIQLNTVTYGLKSSSFLSTRCLKELSIKFKNEFPLASNILLNSTYVDDILHTESDKLVLLEAKSQLVQLLAKGGFELHKWASNESAILTDVPVALQGSGEVNLKKDIKTLGIKFNIEKDSFILSCPTTNQVPSTKREILSFVSQFYDPLGLAGPIFVQAKCILQKLWQSKVDWDSAPPLPLQKEWIQFYTDLMSMPPILIKRNVYNNKQASAELIGFADASNMAYGCVLYLRVTNKSGKISMSLLCSKSRIAPKDNKLSIPRLELNAALLLAKLSNRVHEIILKKMPINGVHLFSDSQVVIAWLGIDPARLNAYVANRVKVINEYTQFTRWLFIKSSLNPADCLSRGVNPSELQNNKLWWNGPEELLNIGYDFKNISTDNLPETLPEVKPSKLSCGGVVCAASHNEDLPFLSKLLLKYSDIGKASRILAYVLRFCKNVKPNSQKVKENFVTFAEHRQALHLFIKSEQNVYFKKDISSLQSKSQVLSNLKGLNPFIDANGLLRLGGRLQHSNLPYTNKHQIILPKESYVTQLLIENEHLKLFHAGQKHVLCSLSQQYWIVNGLRLVKKFIHKCITCFRLKGVTAKQLMGSLPADRVQVARPFEKIGIDFCGPIMVKQSRPRSVLITKGYIAVYVCFVTKAVHIEVVSDLSTEAFLASFKRFISRRNVPSEVYCDNASTFKSASSQLTELYKLFNSKTHITEVQVQGSKLGIKFNFIPAYSPVFGGLWEAAVKSVKHHLKRVLGSHVLTYEQLATVLAQIEAILNSRPITPMSSDTEDLNFLTPGHFLTGAALTCYPEQDISNLPTNRVNFWKICTAMKQQFWRYWSKMYLNVLQNRPKWKDDLPNIKIGSLVILREIDTPPMTWPMARVVNVFPGQDGKVRALEVKKANGKCHRTSVTKVCILPVIDP